MPRKNNGMWYEVHPTPVKGGDGKNLVYVRPKSGMKLSMKELEDYCERNYSLRYGELSRAFDVFVRVAGRFLADKDKLEQEMRECIKRNNGYITAGMFARYTGLTLYSARKQLTEWTKGENPKLLMTPRGKEHIYTEI